MMPHPEGEEKLPAACLICRTMLAEAIDGTLLEAERAVFEGHIASCAACRSELAEAQRGEAWLSLLKSQVLEPPADLLARVLAVTTGGCAPAEGERAVPGVASAEPPSELVSAALPLPLPPAGVPEPVAPGYVWDPHWAAIDAERQVSGRRPETRSLAMRARAAWVSVWATMAQPRLAMTAAMAFFSIALTLNLVGVRLRDLRAAHPSFSALKRTVADADASAARLFQNNRAVYQVESRLNELRSEDAMNDESPERRR